MASESAVIAWGSGEDGQLGIGNNEEREWVCTITSLRSRKISSVVAGSRNSLAICQDGKLFTWGWNQRGTLGHPPETKTESVPSQVKALANVKIVQAAIGGWHCLAVDDQGRAYAWGGNEYGQCGEEPERKEDTGTPIRRDIVIPQRCVPKLSVRQCRQKTRDFAAACTNQAKNNKPCPILYCHKCLLNRYGEKAEEVTISGEWNCPKCRGICNCSICMKKRGQQPTGILINTAKRTGFSSVSEMLLKGGDKFNTESEEAVSHTGTSPKKEAMVSPTRRGKENSFDGKVENTLPNPDGKKVEEGHLKRKETSPDPIEKKLKKMKVTGDFIQEAELNVGVDLEEDNERREEEDGEDLLKLENDDFHAEEVLLPVGRELTSVACIDVPAEDVGSALQFVEFCTVFRNILDIKKGQPESVLRDILHGRTGRHGKFSTTVQLQIQLLSIIQNDQGEECEELGPSSWFNALKECLAESKSVLEAQGLGHIENTDDYETMSASEKLKLLNILCDEVLGTEKLRTWMVDQKTKQKEKVKETRENFLASKNEVKELKKKKQEVVAKAIINGQGGLTISEHEAIVSSIEVETAKARAKMLESQELLANIGQNTNILRTEPIFTSSNGHAYWRLNATGNSELFCLNIGKGDILSSENKWSVLDTDEKESIEKHLSSLSLRGKKGKR